MPTVAIADNSQTGQLQMVAIQEGSGYFSGKNEQVQSVPKLQVGDKVYVPGEEVVEMRAENSKTTYLGKVGKNDKYSVVFYGGPIHYKDNYNDGSEQWKDIDITFIDGKITKAPYELMVDGASVTIRDKKTNSIVAITLSNIGDKPINPPSFVFSKGMAKANDIAVDTDLEVVANNKGIKFTRVMKSALSSPICSFGVSKSGEGINIRYEAVDSKVSGTKYVTVDAILANGILTERVNKLGVVYPLRVDPVLQVYSSSDDGYISRVSTDSNYNSVWSAASGDSTDIVSGINLQEGYLLNEYTIGRGFVYFNTSSIDDTAVVQTAKLCLAQSLLSGTVRGNVTIQSGMPSYPSVPLALTDYNKGLYSGDGGSLPVTSFLHDVYANITLSSTGIGWISLNSTTKFCLRLSGDISGSAPTDVGMNILSFSSSETAAYAPLLYIEYAVPITISTISASNVEESTVTVGGNVTVMGSGNITSYGTQYGTSGSYGSWCNTTATKTAVFSYYDYLGTNTSALSQGTLYYYRAWAYDNLAGYSYGSQLTFQTKPIEPNSFVCTTVNSTAISYTWNKGTGALNTVVVYKNGSYPANIADGTVSYNGTGTSSTQGGLTDGNTYYFRGWSWVSEGASNTYSDLYDGCSSMTYDPPSVTTTAATLVEETTATTGGTITSSPFAVTEWGVQYGTTGSYGSWSNDTGSPGLPYAFTRNLISLSQGEYYYFRAFARHNLGIGYGSQLTFLTKPDVPVLSVTAYNTTAVQLSWVLGTGSDYTYIRYDNVTYPATVAGGTLAGNFSSATTTYILSGLTSLSTYYFSAWGHATAPSTYQFSDLYSTAAQTVPCAPTVMTNSPTGYGNDWVTVSGTQLSGYPASALFGFQYGSTVAYGSWANTTIAVTGGLFSATISGLVPSSSYHYRAFAMNAYGISYGADMTFSTAGTAILYENHQYGCNTTWNQNYESFTTMGSNWTTVQGQNWVAQNFTASSSHSVNQVVIWAKRTATAAAGYIYIGIREANSGQPNTPDLGLGLYAIAYVSTSGGPIEVSLENEIQIESGKNYAIVIRAPGADATNYVQIQYNIAGGASGQMETSTDGGVAWTGSAYDFNYVVIGKPQPVYGNVQVAQTFTVGTSPHTVQRVRLILGRVGQPGNVYVSIRNYTGGVLANADLASVALNGNAITLDKAMYDCVLSPEKSLESGKQYAIVVTAPSGDRYNYVLICADSGAGYVGGTALMSINAGLTWSAQTFDYNFEVWGNACLSVLNAKVFKNYLSTGDWLITAETLNVSPPYYDSNLDPSTLYVLSFMGLTGTTYASTPCELWDKGPLVIYLNPTQAAALTWGGNYKVRLGDLSSTVYSEYALLSTDWSASSLIYLDNWVRLCAKDMEAYKTAKTGTAVSYTTYVANKGYVLNQDGGAIFSQACPRLAYVRPNLFQITSNQPDITTTSAPANVGFFSQDYHTALGSYLSEMIDDGAAAAGIGDPKVFGGIIMLALYAIVAFGTVMKGFAWAGMIAAFPVILLGMYYGLLDVTMIIIILAIMAFLFMREFFFKGM